MNSWIGLPKQRWSEFIWSFVNSMNGAAIGFFTGEPWAVFNGLIVGWVLGSSLDRIANSSAIRSVFIKSLLSFTVFGAMLPNLMSIKYVSLITVIVLTIKHVMHMFLGGREMQRSHS